MSLDDTAPLDPANLFPADQPRPRRRLRSADVDKEEIAARLLAFYTDDLRDREEDRRRRVQRYAKFRMWTEGRNWPWANSSDIGLPDMIEKSLRVQDTLHNAVMSARSNGGVFAAKANLKNDEGKEETIGKLIDYQVFVEARGENLIGELIDSFVNDGCFTAFVPWVREKRDVCERMEFPQPDKNEDFFDYLRSLCEGLYPGALDVYPEGEGWDWCVHPTDDEKVRVSFYTEDDDTDDEAKVFCVVKKYVTVHDGPVVIPMDYDDVICPAGVGNLQAPGPANPGGAPHVMLRSSPTIDEIRTLAATGYYDLVSKEDLETLRPNVGPSMQAGKDEMKRQLLDTVQGQMQSKIPHDVSQGQLTRLVVFDRYDLDGDGLAEDVVFWFLVEPKLLLRARHLTEVFPAKVPRRPLAEATFVPAGGRREGISLLEIQEGIHDVMKELFDITKDSSVLGALPVFFYRLAGTMKPEMLHLFPGMGIPVGDPQRDVVFPQIANPNALGMVLNLMSIVGSWGDRATMIGEFQLGRVPAGRSSALRTTGSVSMLQAQGDARPERILRRLFTGLAQVWSIVHELNCAFLPKGKQIRISGLKRPDEDPFLTIDGREKIDGIYDFEFEANAFNTRKELLQQALMQLASLYLSPIGFQSGLVKPENMYQLLRDAGKAFGLNPDKYLTAPSPEASLPLLSAEDAITGIVAGSIPSGRPAEPGGAMEHLQKLAQFAESDEFGLLTPPQVQAFVSYTKSIMERVIAEQQQQAMAEAAAQAQAMLGHGQGQNPGGAPAQSVSDPDAGPPPVSGGGELTDETLPTAGGGGQEDMAA